MCVRVYVNVACGCLGVWYVCMWTGLGNKVQDDVFFLCFGELTWAPRGAPSGAQGSVKKKVHATARKQG